MKEEKFLPHVDLSNYPLLILPSTINLILKQKESHKLIGIYIVYCYILQKNISKIKPWDKEYDKKMKKVSWINAEYIAEILKISSKNLRKFRKILYELDLLKEWRDKKNRSHIAIPSQFDLLKNNSRWTKGPPGQNVLRNNIYNNKLLYNNRYSKEYLTVKRNPSDKNEMIYFNLSIKLTDELSKYNKFCQRKNWYPNLDDWITQIRLFIEKDIRLKNESLSETRKRGIKIIKTIIEYINIQNPGTWPYLTHVNKPKDLRDHEKQEKILRFYERVQEGNPKESELSFDDFKKKKEKEGAYLF